MMLPVSSSPLVARPGATSRRIFLRRAGLAALAWTAVGASPPVLPPKPSPETEGAALALDLRSQPPALNTSGTLRRRSRDGKWLAPLTVRLEITGNEQAWQSHYHVFEPDDTWRETLRISAGTALPNEYHLTRVGENGRPVAVGPWRGNAASVPLADSDFWWCDLGLEFLHWPAQRVLRTEMRKGRSCRVLESTNPDPWPGVYARVLSWIDLEHGGLLRAEAFGPDQRRLKEFNIGSFKKVDRRWQLKSMEIRQVEADTRTRLEFDLEVEA